MFQTDFRTSLKCPPGLAQKLIIFSEVSKWNKILKASNKKSAISFLI